METNPETEEEKKARLGGLMTQKPLDFWPMTGKEHPLFKGLKYAVNYTMYGFVLFITCLVLLITILVV